MRTGHGLRAWRGARACAWVAAVGLWLAGTAPAGTVPGAELIISAPSLQVSAGDPLQLDLTILNGASETVSVELPQFLQVNFETAAGVRTLELEAARSGRIDIASRGFVQVQLQVVQVRGLRGEAGRASPAPFLPEGRSVRRIDRRTFLAAGAWLLVVPHAAGAQGAQGVHRIGFVSPTGPGVRNEALLRGLRELGYVEGRNLAIAMRFAEGRPERLPGLVDELIRLGIDVLVVGSTVGARAAKAATTTLPVVFAGSSDPVAGNIVKTLARPGGNLTGTSLAYGDGIAGKWLELLVEM